MIFLVSDARTMSGQSVVFVMHRRNLICLKSTNSCEIWAALRIPNHVLRVLFGFSPGSTKELAGIADLEFVCIDGTTDGVNASSYHQ